MRKNISRNCITTENATTRKHRYQPQIIRKHIRVIDILKGAITVEDLFGLHSLNYEMLKGDKAGIESVRVNDQYRIEFTTQRIAAETVITICNILELSNHYKQHTYDK